MEVELFHWFLNGCYLLGGITIGYYYCLWKNRKNKVGTGRWDYRGSK